MHVPRVTYLLLAPVLIAGPAALGSAAPVLRVARAASGTTLLRNGGFEQADAERAAGWAAWQRGYRLAAGEGRGGSRAITCENRGGAGEYGASQTLILDRASAAPLVVRGWSRAEGVSGSPDSGYSLYVDLTYTDGTPLWGQTAEFRCGTHDWEPRDVVIVPEKPVRRLTLHCLFRGHPGKVWFDDVELVEQRAGRDTLLFQGVLIRREPRPPTRSSPRPSRPLKTRDGLQLEQRGNAITSLQVDGRELAAGSPSGFLARDAAANSDVDSFADGACPELGLKLTSRFEAQPDRIVVSGRVSDTRGQDRAITLLYALPVDAAGWRWGDDIRRSRPIQGVEEYSNTVSVRCGSTGTLSLYPLAAVWSDRAGLALALDMGQPAQYRLAYHAGTKQLFIAYDFGLVKETERFPSSADFRFVLYRFDPRWGFRAAWEKSMRLFPEQFAVRSREQGLWMPFTDVGSVEGWQDFGFRYHEGNNNVAWDDAHGILSFRYTEPMTWWMPMPKEEPRTEAEALRRREELAAGRDAFHHRMAEASRAAAMADEDGRPALKFINAPWCDGAVWSLNPNPRLPGPVNAATVHWNDAIRQELYGPQAKGQLDGEYLDSLEGYVTADLNFRRDHFRFSSVPLTFDSGSKRPAIFKGLAVWEFEEWIARETHRLGKLTFANGVPYRFSFLCPPLDLLGTETDWLANGVYRPVSLSLTDLWRTMAGAKPYLLLMNTDFDRFTPEMVERYFQRSLFYGFFPSMFSHNAADNPYWRNPKWYNRDRPLFRKYQPIIRQVAQAGWQPVTHATGDSPNIWVERFGPDASGAVYLTLLNDTAQPQEGRLTVDTAALSIPTSPAGQELVGGQPVSLSGGRVLVRLRSQEAQVVRISGEGKNGTRP
jgi:hypothetical protein